jgi:hypothetical protein
MTPMYITALCAGGGDKRGRDLRWALMFCERSVGGRRGFSSREREWEWEMGVGDGRGRLLVVLRAHRCNRIQTRCS